MQGALRTFAVAAALSAAAGGTARAQGAALPTGVHGAPIRQDQPVTFVADSVTYDRENGIVTAEGHVDAWQNDHEIRADRITFDRNTNVAAARGHVVLLEPDGEVLFSDYAELQQGMKEGVLRGMRALLTQNGKLAANGARRFEGQINELSRVVYSSCDVCRDNPSEPPLWQIRAISAVQDLEHKRIEYTDAELEMAGLPVAYFPFLSHPDPSVKRQSGLLFPVVGYSSHVGALYGQPYYLVLDDQSDATLTPEVGSAAGPLIDVRYRRRFNDGEITTDLTAGYFYNNRERGAQGSIFSQGRFNLDDTWRYGFDVARGSSTNFLNDFKLSRDVGGNTAFLSSQAYIEGFGQGAYARLDAKGYQAINSTTIVSSKIPTVLPRFQYSYLGEPDFLGGRLSVDTQDFNVVRTDGTNTRRASLSVNWERPFVGQLGDLYTLTFHADGATYQATQFTQQPNFGLKNNVSPTRVQPQVALMARWPFMRDSGAWGQQVIEPIAQVIVAPNAGLSQFTKIPNEDSLDLEFTDQNLFSLNRFAGIDRQEGGVRANVGMHTAWLLNGFAFDGLVGQSYRTEKTNLFEQQAGLWNSVSDVVARATVSPTKWLDLTYRTRLDHASLQTRAADALASVGTNDFRVTAGYLYSQFNPYTFYDQPPPPPAGNAYFTPRNEVTLGVSAGYGRYRFNTAVRENVQLNRLDSIGGIVSYEDECSIFDVRLFQRYTSINGDHGATTILFELTFKTVGQIGFRAL